MIELKDDLTVKSAFVLLWEARQATLELFNQLPLRVCVAPATKLVNSIDAVLPREWNEAIKMYPSEEELGYRTFSIKNGARELETVLEAELQSLDTYLVSQKGTHSTPDLIERAEIMFPLSIRTRLPANAIQDIRQAGRCLALDNPTASGFHILRAIEGVMAIYFDLVTGKPMTTRMRNWGIYLKTLGKHPDHSPKVVAFLNHLRENYRNPILHPEIFLNEDEAEILLGAAATAIRMLVLEIEAVELKARSLPLPLVPSPSLPPVP